MSEGFFSRGFRGRRQPSDTVLICGQPIPEKRLEALPWASLCLTCEPEPGSEG